MFWLLHQISWIEFCGMIYNEWMVVNMNWLASLGKVYVWVRNVAIFWYVLQNWLMVFLLGNILYRLSIPSPGIRQTLMFLDCKMVEVEKSYIQNLEKLKMSKTLLLNMHITRYIFMQACDFSVEFWDLAAFLK